MNNYKFEKVFIVAIFIMAVLSFITSTTDWIIKENKPVFYPVSIIVNEVGESNFVNFRRGVDRAASEYNVDINFITLFENGNLEDQVIRIKEEIEGGAKALLVAPVCGKGVSERIVSATTNKGKSTPLVFFEYKDMSNKISSVSVDYKEVGEKLADAVIEERKDKNKARFAYIVYSKSLGGYNTVLEETISERLLDEGFLVEEMAVDEKGTEFSNKLENFSGEDNSAFVICLDKSSLLEISDIVKLKPKYRWFISGIYGLGNTTSILSNLEEGIINGLVVWDEYSEGYLSVENAISQIKIFGTKSQELLENYYITSKDLREERFMKMLYPID
jgi:hypothetical protein